MKMMGKIGEDDGKEFIFLLFWRAGAFPAVCGLRCCVWADYGPAPAKSAWAGPQVPFIGRLRIPDSALMTESGIARFAE